MDPTDADTLKNLAEAAKGQGELEMAQGYFLRLLSEFPDQVRGGQGRVWCTRMGGVSGGVTSAGDLYYLYLSLSETLQGAVGVK
jgi:hypothetical protein